MSTLTHLKVLDLSRILAGPWASQTLADLGAEVIKVEHPEGGDDTRRFGPPYLSDEQGKQTKESAYYLSANRGKKSVCIDITTTEGQARVQELASQSDIFIENFKVGTAKKYKLDYASLSQINPRLIYCSITGFGQTGPYAERPGYDFLIQGMGGLMSITGAPDAEGGQPQKVGVAVTDLMTGLYASIGILAAVAEREKSGRGQHIDLALLDVSVAMLANQASNYVVGKQIPTRMGNAHPNIVPYQAFSTKDGHCIISVGNDQQFKKLATALGDERLATDPKYQSNDGRVKNRESLIPMLQNKLLQQTSAYWLALFDKSGIPAGPINNIDQVFDDAQVKAREMLINIPHPDNADLQLVANPLKFSRTPIEYTCAPPKLGQHDDELLK